MAEYTPTTDSMRRAYVALRLSTMLAPSNSMDEARAAAGSEFDRWLASEIRRAKAEAWDEGYERADPDLFWHDGGRDNNPYRATQLEGEEG